MHCGWVERELMMNEGWGWIHVLPASDRLRRDTMVASLESAVELTSVGFVSSFIFWLCGFRRTLYTTCGVYPDYAGPLSVQGCR